MGKMKERCESEADQEFKDAESEDLSHSPGYQVKDLLKGSDRMRRQDFDTRRRLVLIAPICRKALAGRDETAV
jgi:hypothetical protein